jgi:hypothetical protein
MGRAVSTTATSDENQNEQSMFADKSWLKVLFADLLLEKNTVKWLADSTNKFPNRLTIGIQTT